jgi:hypothetical protein
VNAAKLLNLNALSITMLEDGKRAARWIVELVSVPATLPVAGIYDGIKF